MKTGKSICCNSCCTIMRRTQKWISQNLLCSSKIPNPSSNSSKIGIGMDGSCNPSLPILLSSEHPQLTPQLRQESIPELQGQHKSQQPPQNQIEVQSPIAFFIYSIQYTNIYIYNYTYIYIYIFTKASVS